MGNGRARANEVLACARDGDENRKAASFAVVDYSPPHPWPSGKNHRARDEKRIPKTRLGSQNRDTGIQG